MNIDHIGFGEDRKKIAYANRDVLKKFFGVLKVIKDYAKQFKRRYEKIILCGMVFDEKEKRMGEIEFERG